MKLSIINDIAETCAGFTCKVIDEGESLDYDELVRHVDKYCDSITEHSDDTIDIDYKDMSFTVRLNKVLGQWELCPNACYYVIKGGLLNDTIGIELF